MRPHVTGSAVDRFLACQHWAHPTIALPKVPQNAAMAEGTRRHKIAEAVLRGANPFPAPEDHVLVGSATALRERASILQTEQGYAYDPLKKTARLIAGRTDEGYQGAEAHEIPITIDAVYRDVESVLVVRDWKLGATGVQYQPSPERAGQLLLGMLCVRASGAFATDAMAIEFADDHTVYRSPITHAALNEFADRLETAWIWTVSHKEPQAPVTGSHCKWCPLISSCAAHHAIVQQSADTLINKRRLPLSIQTKQDADDFVALSDFVEDYLDRMKDQLKVWATTHVVTKAAGKSVQQYRSELVAPSLSTTLRKLDEGPQAVELRALYKLPDDAELVVVHKHKGEAKPQFRWRKI
jgi:hypothetical protein